MDGNNKSDLEMPIQVSRDERWKTEINPLQIKMELIRTKEDSMHNRPFLGIKYQTVESEKIESVWFGILDINEKKVTHCMQIDINKEEK